jgi:magnesium-transporting ATPase (P-type)
LIKNSRPTPSKRSIVDKTVNVAIVIIFIVQGLMCVISTFLHANWNATHKDSFYLPFLSSQSTLTTTTAFITFFILYNNLVPISLYVSLETVKLVQAKFMRDDLKMYYPKLNQPAMAR